MTNEVLAFLEKTYLIGQGASLEEEVKLVEGFINAVRSVTSVTEPITEPKHEHAPLVQSALDYLAWYEEDMRRHSALVGHRRELENIQAACPHLFKFKTINGKPAERCIACRKGTCED